MSRFRRRLMGLTQLREAKRKDFVRVEYIENTSTAYIDTNVKSSNNISLQLKYIFKKNTEDTNSGFMFGSRITNLNQEYGIINSYVSQFRFGNNASLSNFIVNEDTLVTLDNTEIHNELKIFDSSNNLLHTLTTTNNSFSNNLNLYIFGMNNNGSLNPFKDTTKLYSCKIYDGTTLIRDYIPMYQISKDTYGLWDRVEQRFYTSPNGVKFTGGERVIADANENLYYLKNYINVSNNQRKDLGFQPVGNDSWEGKFYFIGTGRQDILGAWNSQGQRQYGFMGIDNHQMRFLYNTQTIYNTLSYGNKTFTLKAEKNKFYIYDSTNKLIWNGSATYTSGNNPVRTFNVGHLDGSVYASNARMYYFKYMRGDNLVWDLIPVQRCSDKVWGVFCKVHNSFYESDGSTAFTGG